MGSRSGLDSVENGNTSCPCLDLNPGPSNPKPSHYIVYIISAPEVILIFTQKNIYSVFGSLIPLFHMVLI